VNDSRDNLSTADLAGQTPGRAGRDGYDEPDRSAVRDQPGSSGPDTSAGVADDVTSSVGDPAHDDPARADYDGDATGATRSDHDGDLGLRPPADPYSADAGVDATGERRDDSGPGPVGTHDRDADDPAAVGSHTEDRDDPGPVRTDVPPAAASTVDTAGAGSTVESTTGPLLGATDSEGFRARWTDVQTGFVDAPREAVQKADALVAELMQHLAATFADERGKLEHQWDRGDDVPTDDLRDAFQRYRSFFERLLST
jgi:hypothetical protein